MNSILIMSATQSFSPAEKDTHDQTHFLLGPQADWQRDERPKAQ
jgi:hypothetical protein